MPYKLKLLLIGSIAFVFFLGLALYSNFKTWGFLNYSVKHELTEVGWNERQEEEGTVFEGTINARDNYMGSLTFNIAKLSDFEGELVFRLKEGDGSDWLVTNTYPFSYFIQQGHNTFGFPQIDGSMGKSYQMQLAFKPQGVKESERYLNVNDLVQSKYVFPKKEILANKQTLVYVTLRRVVAGLQEINYFPVVAYSLLVVLAFVWASRISAKSSLNEKLTFIFQTIEKFNPFWGGLLILIGIGVSLIANQLRTAEILAVWFWVVLVFSIVIQSVHFGIHQYLTSWKGKEDKLIRHAKLFIGRVNLKTILIVISVLLVGLAGLDKNYILGGDDSRLFYLYPERYVANFASQVASNTGVSEMIGFLPPRSIFAFGGLMQTLKSIFIASNLQSVMNTANILGGLLGFYALLNYLLKPRDLYGKLSCGVAAFAYVYSIFNFYVLFNAKLLAIFLISIFPISLWLFIKAVKESKVFLLAIVALLWSVFSLIAVAFPWFAASVLVAIPFSIIALKGLWTRTVKYLMILVLFLGVLNLHWLVYAPYSLLINKQLNIFNTGLSSQTFRESTTVGVSAVSSLNTPLFPLLNLYHQQIQINNNWPYLPINYNWYSRLIPLGAVFFLILLWAGRRMSAKDELLGFYVGSVASLLLAIYFFTVNITPWGINLFVWLTEKIPGFVVFRNMYDKFAYSLALTWGLVLGVSLIKIRSKYLLLFVAFASLMWAKPYLLGEFDSLPLWTTKNIFNSTRELNKDYLELVDYVKDQPESGRYLSIPLQSGNAFSIQDEKQENHYYNGVSPLLLLTGKNDLSGLVSFGDLGRQVKLWLTDGDYVSIGKLMQILNTRYVIVSNIVSEDLKDSFIYSDGIYNLQTPAFIKEMLGPKVRDFGKRYSLYEINPKYFTYKIYLSDNENYNDQQTEVTFNQETPYLYSLEINNLSKTQNLIFLEPFFKQWQLYTKTNSVVLSDAHFMALGYANGWRLDPKNITNSLGVHEYSVNSDGSLNLHLTIKFTPYEYLSSTWTISAMGYLLLGGFVIGSLLKKK